MGSPEWVIWNVTGHTLLWLTRATCSWWWIWSNKVIKVDYRWSKYDYYLHIEGLFFGCLSFTSAPLLLMTFFQQFVKFNHPREEALSQADPFPLPCSSQDHLRKGKSFHHSGQEWVSSLPCLGCSPWIPWVVTWFNVPVRPSSQNGDKANHMSEWLLRRKAKEKSTDIESLIYVIIIAVVVCFSFIFIGSLFGNDTEESRKEGPSSSVWPEKALNLFIDRQIRTFHNPNPTVR